MVSYSAYCCILKMEATCSSETLIDFQQSTRRDIPEHRTIHNHRFENLKPYLAYFIRVFLISTKLNHLIPPQSLV
jgi:hypothetical protein